ncbi:MAG: NTP transferase domain-containing protein [Rhodoglobus sp.]
MALPANTPASDTTGIVLAAGAGTRAGGPKALLRLGDGMPWVAVAATVLLDAGCRRVVVVLGAMERLARPLVPADERVSIVVAADWQLGMSASLRAGLAAATGAAALVTLVDLPWMPVAVAQRVGAGPTAAALRQATFDGRPGHPVLIGSEHWSAVAASLAGDHGARKYLVDHGVEEIECGDLWDGADRDDG